VIYFNRNTFPILVSYHMSLHPEDGDRNVLRNVGILP